MPITLGDNDITGASTINGSIVVTNSLEVRNTIGDDEPFRIGNGFGSGGTGTIHKFNSPLFLQFNNGETNTSVVLGGGGTNCNLSFSTNTSGIKPNFDSGWISANVTSQTNSTLTHNIPKPYKVVLWARVSTATGTFSSQYSTGQELQIGFNAPQNALGATGVHLICNDNNVRYIHHQYVAAARNGSQEGGFIQKTHLRFFIYRVGV